MQEQKPALTHSARLNESPSQKEGKSWNRGGGGGELRASMKAPPNRKGNVAPDSLDDDLDGLNESPSEKEGKFRFTGNNPALILASMKALPKRKGN